MAPVPRRVSASGSLDEGDFALLRSGVLSASRLFASKTSAMSNHKYLIPSVAFLLTSCAATGSDPHRVTDLVPGISTKEDAIAKLGPPTSTSKIGDRTLLQWTDNNSSRPGHIVVLFGMDGRMIEAASDAEGSAQPNSPTR